MSVVSNYSSLPEESYFAQLIDKTSGTHLNTNGYANPSDLSWDIYNWLIGGAEFKYISSVGLTELPPVFNKAYLTKINSFDTQLNDYDKDGLIDREEIAFDSPLISTYPTFELPTIGQCHDFVSKGGKLVYSEESLERFRNELVSIDFITKTFARTKIVPINSDPVLADGDGDFMLDCYDNDLDKTTYDNIIDQSPLYSFSNTTELYGLNNAGILIKKTKSDRNEFFSNSPILLDKEITYSFNGTILGDGIRNGKNIAAVGEYRFSFEIQEYMQSVCETIINNYIDNGENDEVISYLRKYLTPSLIIAIGTTESGWKKVKLSKLGLTKDGVDCLKNCVGGTTASNNLAVYSDLRSDISASAVLIAHAIKVQISGDGEAKFFNNQRNSNGSLNEGQVLYNALVIYAAGEIIGYSKSEAAMSSAYKLYSFTEIAKNRKDPIDINGTSIGLSNYTYFNGINEWTFNLEKSNNVERRRIELDLPLLYK
jgi:hypothetical protein